MKILLTEEQLQEGVAGLAAQLREHYGHEPLTVVGVLTGSLVFLADVIRQLDMPLRVGLVQASSYRGATTTRSPLSIDLGLLTDLRGRHVLLVDDIFDTGNTLLEVISQLDDLAPASIRSAVLLRKALRCEVAIEPDHVVFDIPDAFVVGYGLDYNDLYRNLPHVATLEEDDLIAAKETHGDS